MKILKKYNEHPDTLRAEGLPVGWFETTEKEFIEHTENSGYVKKGCALEMLESGAKIITCFALYKEGEMKCYICKKQISIATRIFMKAKDNRERAQFRDLCHLCYNKEMEKKGLIHCNGIWRKL